MDRRAPSHRRQWWALFAVLALLATMWSLASPLFSVPDEPAHVVRAAAVARGQLTGTQVEGSGPDDRCVADVAGPDTGPVSCTYFDLPAVFAAAYDVPGCFNFTPEVTADCAPPLRGSTRVTPVATTAGSNPPLFYLLAGIPSLPFPSELGVRLMRVAGAAASAALLASAFLSAGHASRLAVAGVLVAVTPMTLYLAGSVNPNGLEAAAAVGLWASGAALATGARHRLLARRAGVAAVVLALSRPLSPLWVALTGLSLLVAVAPAARADLFADRRVRIASAAAVAATTLGVAWTALARPLAGALGEGARLGTGDLIERSLGSTMDRLANMVGELGWLDTRAPALAVALWLLVTGYLAVSALAVATRAQAVALVGLAVAVVAVPVAVEVSQAPRLGLIWQGRYALPLAVGVPILAACVAGARLAGPATRALPLIATATAAGHAAVFWWGLRRYAVGLDSLVGPVRWSPPLLPAVALGLLFTVAVAGFSWLVVRTATAPAFN